MQKAFFLLMCQVYLLGHVAAAVIQPDSTGMGRAMFFATDFSAANSLWDFQKNELLDFSVNESFSSSYTASGTMSLKETYLEDSLSQSVESTFSISVPTIGTIFRNLSANATSFFAVTTPSLATLNLDFNYVNAPEYLASYLIYDETNRNMLQSESVSKGQTVIQFNLSPGRYQLQIDYARSPFGQAVTENESHSASFKSQLTLVAVPEPSAIGLVAAAIVALPLKLIRRRRSALVAKLGYRFLFHKAIVKAI